jgi:hypothetical protein
LRGGTSLEELDDCLSGVRTHHETEWVLKMRGEREREIILVPHKNALADGEEG